MISISYQKYDKEESWIEINIRNIKQAGLSHQDYVRRNTNIKQMILNRPEQSVHMPIWLLLYSHIFMRFASTEFMLNFNEASISLSRYVKKFLKSYKMKDKTRFKIQNSINHLANHMKNLV